MQSTKASGISTFHEELARKLLSAAGDVSLDLNAVGRRLNASSIDDFEEIAPELDRALSRGYSSAEALARVARTSCPPRYERFDIGEHLQRWSPASIRQMSDGSHAENRSYAMGDARHVSECLDLLRNGVQLGDGGGLRMDWFPDRTSPTLMALAVRGARFLPDIVITETFHLSWSDFGALWASATNGGVIAQSSTNAIALPFRGPGCASSGCSAFLEVEKALRNAAFALLPWRGAFGAADTGYLALTEGLRLYKKQVSTAELHLTRARERLAASFSGSPQATWSPENAKGQETGVV